MRAHPYVPENYNGLPVSTNTSSATVSPLASSEESGYAKSNTFYFQSNVSLKYDFPFLKGLSAKFMVAYDYSQTYSKIYSTPFRTMVATLPTTLDGNISYAENWDSRKKSENSLTEGLTRNTQITTNASLNYANTFGKHNVSAILLMETYSNDGNNFSAYGEGFSIKELAELKYASIPDKMSINGMSSVARKAGFAARVNYDYANKYLVELSCRYDGSYLFGGMVDGKRWSPFPAASVGWRISNEPWFDSKAIDNLKLRASIGLTGTTGISAYSYLNTLGFLDTPAVVLGGVGVDGMLTSSLANENLTWAKNLQYNGGFDLSMWGGRLGVEFDVFYKYIYDILSGVTATYPSSFGGYYPKYENSNKQAHKGFEITLSHRNRVGDFNYNVSLTGTYTKRKWLHYNDAANTPDWLKLTGKEVGAQVGFISAGLFQSQEGPGGRCFARLVGWFCAGNLLLAGALLLPGAQTNNGCIYLPLSPGALLAGAGGVVLAVQGVLRFLGRGGGQVFPARLTVADTALDVRAFCDTGFSVQEPLSGRTVVLVRFGAVQGRLPPALGTYLEQHFAGAAPLPVPALGVRLVPCTTVAGHCILPAVPASLCCTGSPAGQGMAEHLYAAFADLPPPPDGWEVLVGNETVSSLAHG